MLLTIDEALKHFKVKNKEAIYNRVRRGSLEKIVKDGLTYYEIVDNKKANTNKTNTNTHKKVSVRELEELKIQLTKIETELKSKNELISSKDELITELKQSKQEQAEHIGTLKLTCNLLERENSRLLQLQAPHKEPSENIIIKQTPKAQKTEEPQDEKPQNLKIDLSKKLLDDGLNEKERKRVKARFNKRIGEREITKEQKKIYISKNENYEDLLKV